MRLLFPGYTVPLTLFEPFSRLAGGRLFGLQKNAGLRQFDVLEGKFPVTDLGRKLNENTGPFMETRRRCS